MVLGMGLEGEGVCPSLVKIENASRDIQLKEIKQVFILIILLSIVNTIGVWYFLDNPFDGFCLINLVMTSGLEIGIILLLIKRIRIYKSKFSDAEHPSLEDDLP